MGSTDEAGRGTAPVTLSFDIGGSHLKAGVLDPAGSLVSKRVRVATPKVASRKAVIDGLAGLARRLQHFDRISIGFPGVVRGGIILTAPHLGTKEWQGFDLAAAIAQELGKPVRILNDASVQGLGVISGRGTECVLTMGTGMGFALFCDGRLAPHLELSQHPIKGGKTYDEYVGAHALGKIGPRHWNRRVRKIIDLLETVVMYDTLYIGGGNARLLESGLQPNVKPVSNEAGITGGVRVWDNRMNELFDSGAFAIANADEDTR
jgi:polyphosphate glucokinase